MCSVSPLLFLFSLCKSCRLCPDVFETSDFYLQRFLSPLLFYEVMNIIKYPIVEQTLLNEMTVLKTLLSLHRFSLHLEQDPSLDKNWGLECSPTHPIALISHHSSSCSHHFRHADTLFLRWIGFFPARGFLHILFPKLWTRSFFFTWPRPSSPHLKLTLQWDFLRLSYLFFCVFLFIDFEF